MITFLIDVVYIVVLLLASPWLVFKAVRTGKYRAGIAQKLLGAVPQRTSGNLCVWFHAVSVGEVMMLRRVVADLIRCRPDLDIVISTTTNSGMDVALQHFASHSVIYFPLDLSWSVARAIGRIRPDVVVLAELELWPNFIAAAKRSGARLAVINGRMSPRSYRGYSRARFFMRSILAKVDAFAIQTDEFATRFIGAGAPAERVAVTGSVKYDGVETERNNPGTRKLRDLFDFHRAEIVWVAGSTSDPEEQIVLDAYAQLRSAYPELRLILVPRHKERFDEVVRMVDGRGYDVLRRSQMQADRPAIRGKTAESATTQSSPNHRGDPFQGSHRPVIVIDTLGELSAVWGLADVAFVGGTFAPRGGQNMIEPAGYGAAVIVGPGVWNFQDTVNHLLACGGIVQVTSPRELTEVMGRLLADRQKRDKLGQAASSFVRTQSGATMRTVELLDQLLPSRPEHRSTAA
jgi:3-deoxy-D-manno-octulosonic-acid transferase